MESDRIPIERLVEIMIEIVRARGSISFDELRQQLEEEYGIYMDGLAIRKIAADLIRRRVLCKTPNPLRRKMMLTLCR